MGERVEIARPQSLYDRGDRRLLTPRSFIVDAVDPSRLRTRGRFGGDKMVWRRRRKGAQNLADTLAERRAPPHAERHGRPNLSSDVPKLRIVEAQPEELVQSYEHGRRVRRTTTEPSPHGDLLAKPYP